MNTLIIGPASRSLGIKLGGELDVEKLTAESKTFPDGESYIKIPTDSLNGRCVVLQSTYPPQDRHLIELFLMLDVVRDLGASEVVGVVPYLAYSRQDKRFLPGEAVSIKTIIQLIEKTGIKEFYTFNIHKETTLNEFSIKSHNLSAIPSIGRNLIQRSLKDPLVIAPDTGALNLARSLADFIKSDYSFFDKERDKMSGKIKTYDKEVDVKGRDVVIIDDLISTGSTIANVARLVKKQGAKRILASCIHPLLAEGALERMKENNVNHLIGTDCVESPVSEVTVAPELAEALRKNV